MPTQQSGLPTSKQCRLPTVPEVNDKVRGAFPKPIFQVHYTYIHLMSTHMMNETRPLNISDLVF